MEAEAVLNPPLEHDLETLRAPGLADGWMRAEGPPFRILEEDGGADDRLVADFAPETLQAMLREMILVRSLDTRAVNLHRQGRIGFHVPSLGEEGLQIGSAFALQKDDWVFSAFRELGVALHRGYPLELLLSQFFGNGADLLKGRQMPDHYGHAGVRFSVASSPVGTQIPHAAGAGYALKLRGEPNCVIVYFGDGATSTGYFHAGMNFAGLHRLPVVFFCKNNGWAISLPRERQTASPTLAQKALGYGFDGLQVDGNDAVAVYHVTQDALTKARRGDGPTMIEAISYRMGPHSTADDPSRYRSAEELESWKARDPLLRFARFLESRGLWSEDEDDRSRAEAEARVSAAVEWAEQQGAPAPASMFDDVYAELPWHLLEQRDDLLDIRSEN